MAPAYRWRKSSFSGADNGCVEVRHVPGADMVGVRDTKNRAAGHLNVPAKAWPTFLHAVKTLQLEA